MSSNPYENEPGFENAHTDQDKKAQKDYVQKVSKFQAFPRIVPLLNWIDSA